MVKEEQSTLLANDKTSDSAAVVSGAIASGGLIGAGLAILALELPPSWQRTALAVVPTVASSFALIVRVVGLELRRRYSKKLWRSDRDDVVFYAENAIPLMMSALNEFEDPEARQILENGIARMQRLKALALTAYPSERPWLQELRHIVETSVPLATPQESSTAQLSRET